MRHLKKRMSMSRLFGVFVVLGLGVLGLSLGLLAANGLNDAFERQLNRLVDARVQSATRLLSSYTLNRSRVLADLATTPMIIQGVMQPGIALANAIDLLESVKVVGQHPRMTLFDFEGQLLYDSSRAETCLPETEARRQMLLGEQERAISFHSPCPEGPLAKEPFVRFMVPVYWRERPEGLLAADIPLSSVEVLQEINQGSPLEAVAIYKDGREIYAPKHTIHGLHQAKAIPELGITLRFSMDISGVNKERTQLLAMLSGVMLLLIVVFTLLAIYVGRRLFVRPMAELQQRAGLVRKGTMPPPMRHLSPVLEVVTLDEALQEMARAVLAKHKELEEQVSEREQVAQALRESKKLLAATGRTAKVGGWQYDQQSGELTWTRETYHIHELDEDYHPTVEKALEFYPPEGRIILTDALERLLTHDEPWDLELPFVTAAGNRIWVRARGERSSDPQQPQVVTGTIQDITERKETELALRQSEEFNKRIIESSPDCIKVLDRQGRLRYMSPGGQRLMCIQDISPFLGLYYPELMPQAEREVAVNALDSARKGRTAAFQVYMADLECVPHWWSVTVTPILDPEGRLQRFLVVSRDVSDIKKAEVELRKAMEEAIDANRAKSEFLANMSHEIRTPMNGILGMAQLLAATPLSGDQRESLHTIETSAKTLLRLINDILDLSKIEAEKMELHAEAFSLEPMVREVVDTLAPQATRKGIAMDWSIAPDVPRLLQGDVKRLRQVCINLLGNAVKFTEEGGVRLDVSCLGECITPPESEQGAEQKLPVQEIRFSVQDTGIGISEDAQKRIFDTFSQADGSSSRTYGGTGLGLSISRRLVALMGGELLVQSAPGMGSTFSFSVPFGLPPATEQAEEDTQPGEHFTAWGQMILVVDDNQINRLVARRMLERTGNTVHLAASGAEALELLQVNNYAIIFMDVQMPGMDGLQTTAAVRESQNLVTANDVHIVAMTAHAMKGDRERFLGAGMNDYLPKPLSMDNLQNALRRYVEGSLADMKPGQGAALSLDLQHPPRPVPDLQSFPLWERDKALLRFAEDMELFQEACKDFLRSSSGKIEAIGAALDRGEFQNATLHAHSLKGNSATIGASRLAACGEELESACRDEDVPRARTLLSEARTQFEDIAALLR